MLLERPPLGLMLTDAILKFLIFQQEALHFHFALGSWHYTAALFLDMTPKAGPIEERFDKLQCLKIQNFFSSK